MGIIAEGIARQSSTIRLAGMALIVILVDKLFAFDVFLMDRLYRVAAFVSLGVLLLATGLAYQRYSHAFKDFSVGKKGLDTSMSVGSRGNLHGIA